MALRSSRLVSRSLLVLLASFHIVGCGEEKEPVLMTDAVAVAVGEDHACAIRTGGRVACWGRGTFGQLGYGEFTESGACSSSLCYGDSTVPREVVGLGGEGVLDDAVRIAAGGHHTCVVRRNGGVACWGWNDGRLGNGALEDSKFPVAVRGIDGVGELTDAVDVVAGTNHSCALRSNGQVVCWGLGWSLGRGADQNSDVPVDVLGVGGEGVLTDVIAISNHWDTTCALLQDGWLACWGPSGEYGMLGNGTWENTLFVTYVSGIGTAVATGGTCAILDDERVMCWGYDLGRGDDSEVSNVPVLISSLDGFGILSGVTAVTRGSGSCALRGDGMPACWGQVSSAAEAPVLVPGIEGEGQLEGVVDISVGGYACAVLEDGHVACWNAGDHGALGRRTLIFSSVPVYVWAPK
jgi:alpha-tubulin suppressor-like RCC1 family protein